MRRSLLIIIILFSCFLSVTCSANIIYVKYNATGANDGSSWANAYTSLMSAIPSVGASDSVWVAAGTYTPVPVTASTSFFITTGTFIGHFAGNETKVSDRDLQNAAYETILSGQSLCYHVINGSGSFQLDGFTISSAYANGDPSFLRSQGGGILYSESTGTVGLTNCIFKNNYAADGGSAIFTFFGNLALTLKKCTFENNNGYSLYLSSTNAIVDSCEFENNSGVPLTIDGSLQMTHCTFSQNTGGGMELGALAATTVIANCQFISNGGDFSGNGANVIIDADNNNNFLRISDCVFQGNISGDAGAVRLSAGVFTNCLFSNNIAGSAGGAVTLTSNASAAWGSDSCKFINCAFENNEAVYFQGGAVHADAGKMSFSNCTFYNNSAPGTLLGQNTFSSTNGTGGAIDGGNATLSITNSIFWKNIAATTDSSKQQISGNGTIKINNSLVQGGCPFNASCSGDIQSDPLFADPTNNNFALSACSPAINMGLNDSVPSWLTLDLAGNPRILDGIVDMGAYETKELIIDSFTKNVMPTINSFSSTDFSSNYSDPVGALQKIKILSLPAEGILELDRVPIAVDTIIDVSNIAQLSFVADSCAVSTSFTWSGMSVANICSFSKSALVNLTMTNSPNYGRPVSPVITANGPVIFCVGDSVVLSAATGYEGYLWNNNDSTNSIEVKTAGIYTVQGENHHCYSAASDAIVVTENFPPAVTIVNNGTRCGAGNTSVIVTGGSGYLWYADSSSTSPIGNDSSYHYINLIQTDTLYVSAETNGCYSKRYSVVTHIDTLPTKPLVSDTTVCYGFSLNLSVKNYYSGYSYKWYTYDGSIASQIGRGETLGYIDPTIIQNDSIMLIQAEDNNTCTNTDTIKVIIAPLPPTPSLVYDSLAVVRTPSITKCFPDSIQLLGIPTGYQYEWTVIRESDDSITNTFSNLNQQNISQSSIVLLHVISSQGCTSSNYAIVEAIIDTAEVPSIIENNNDISVTSNFASYQWYYNDTIINNATSATYAPMAKGSYTVQTVDQNGCAATSAAVVFVLPPAPPVIPPADTASDSSTNIVVYPNPSSGYITISFPSTIKQISIYNSIGQILQTKYVEGETITGFMLANSGAYLVKLITDNEKIIVKKVVISH